MKVPSHTFVLSAACVRPTVILASRADTYATSVLEKILANEADLELLAGAGIHCEICEHDDIRLQRSSKDVVVIVSARDAFGGGVFRPQAPQSILPSDVKNGGTTWAVVLNGGLFQKSSACDRREQIAHHVVLWFTTKWNETKDGCLPWGPLPSANNRLHRKARNRGYDRSSYLFC